MAAYFLETKATGASEPATETRAIGVVLLSESGGELTPYTAAGTPASSDYGFLGFRNTAVSNTAVAVKASAGNVFGIRIINTNANSVFVKFYNVAAASVVVGTTTIAGTIVVPGGSSTNPAMVWITPTAGSPIFPQFTTAIALAATANLTDSDATAPGSALQISVMYI